MYLAPSAVKETAPRSSFPFVLFGVLYVHVAEPFPARPTPVSFVAPAVPAHVMALGLTGVLPAVMRTEATTVDPAFGFAGESLAAPTLTPPPGVGGGAVSATTTVTEAVSFDGSGSGSEADTISARRT